MKALALLFLLSAYQPLRAGEGPIDPENEARARHVGKGIRCAVCQGMSITDSPAPMAQAMLDKVRELVREGKTDDQIRAYFVQRYGEWILLEPPAHGFNWLVWLLPFLGLVAGGFIIARFYQRSRAAPHTTAAPEESEEEDAYLQAVRKEIEQ